MDMMACEDSKKMRRVCKPFRALSWGVVWETHAPPDVHVCALLDEWRRCEPHGDSPQPFIDVMFRQSECKVEVLFLSYIGYARVTRHHACKCLARICLIYRLQGHLSSYSISIACIDFKNAQPVLWQGRGERSSTLSHDRVTYAAIERTARTGPGWQTRPRGASVAVCAS